MVRAGDLPEGMAEYMKAVSCGQYGAAKNKVHAFGDGVLS